ncbi:hypothetical protein LCGC14_2799160, partial [marine sediment metagenome]
MTRIDHARKGVITDEVRAAASSEGISPEQLSSDIAEGLSVIPRNIRRGIKPIGIGRGLSTKINANIGTSRDRISFEEEKEKLKVILKHGGDALMELSTGGPIKELREYILKEASIPVGTVPIYEAVIRGVEACGSIAKITAEDFFMVIQEQAEQGVDFITVHSGLTLKAVQRLKEQGRTLDIVSRGGSFLLE